MQQPRRDELTSEEEYVLEELETLVESKRAWEDRTPGSKRYRLQEKGVNISLRRRLKKARDLGLHHREIPHKFESDTRMVSEYVSGLIEKYL